MQPWQQQFIELAIARQAIKFGEFTLKSGRKSPWFFNAGHFNRGSDLAILAGCYASALMHSGIAIDVLFGPAYKGIPLVSVTAMALANQHQRDLPYCFNRKEAKDHGEGGALVGSPLQGRVLLIDDVITAGSAIRESVKLIKAAGATLAGVLIALDRQERGLGELSAIQEVQRDFGCPVISIISLDNLLSYLQQSLLPACAPSVQPSIQSASQLSSPAFSPAVMAQHLAALTEYRQRYGVSPVSAASQ